LGGKVRKEGRLRKRKGTKTRSPDPKKILIKSGASLLPGVVGSYDTKDVSHPTMKEGEEARDTWLIRSRWLSMQDAAKTFMKDRTG